MFCPNCGSPIEDGTKFCENCGAQIKQNTTANTTANTAANTSANNTSAQPEANVGGPRVPVHALPKKPIPKQAVAAAAGVVVLLAAGGFAYSKLSNTLNLNKYMTVTFEGYDGYGRAYAELDTEKLYKDWGKKLKIKDKDVRKSYEDMADRYGLGFGAEFGIDGKVKDNLGYIVLMSGIENCYTLDTSSRLTNGDQVELSWDVQDVYTEDGMESIEDVLGIKLKANEKEYKVDGLEEAGTFDAFANVEVSFSGVAPNGEVSFIDNNDVDLDIECSPRTGLSDGDTVTLTITNNDITRIVENCGGVPEAFEKEYTVSGLDSYVQSIASVSEDTMNQMIAQGENILRAKAASDWGDQKKLLSVAYQGCYLLKARYPEQANLQNSIGLVYQMTANVSDSDFTQDITYYCYVSFDNLLNDGEGITSVNMSDYEISRSRVSLSYGWWSWYFYGSQTIEDLKTEFVTANLDRYDYEESFAQ